MSTTQSQSIPQDKFLTMAANLLYRALLEPSRTEAKKHYRELEQGGSLHLTDVRMEDQSTVRFMLALDQSELNGKLNYGAFRASVATLIHNIGEQLKGEDPSVHIRYPGGRSFYIDPEIEDVLEQRGVRVDSDKLENLFWPFVSPEVRYHLRGMRHRGDGPRRGQQLTQHEVNSIRKNLHIFGY